MGSRENDSVRLALAAWHRLRAWIARPFDSLYRWAVPVLILAACCFALPAWVGLLLFLPFAAVLLCKTVQVARRIHRLEFVGVVVDAGGTVLDTARDRMQRAWALGCASIIGAVLASLVLRVVLSVVSGFSISGVIATYVGFAVLLMGGFLLFYVLALRFDGALLRGMASVTVTLPAFFIIVAVASILLSWLMRIVGALGLSAEKMIADGFAWLYDVQRVLGMATDYFLQQDPLIIGGSIVFAALLLLLYTATVPQYWRKSVTWWLRAMGLVAVVFSGAVIIFAGTWVVDVQEWASGSEGGKFAQGIDESVISRQAASLSGYQSDDLVALAKSLVLPYTVGVFVANAVLMLRAATAKRISDDILNDLAKCDAADDLDLDSLKRRYLYFGGSPMLWDIVLRSIGFDIPLPNPFVPRKLTLAERLTGELEDDAYGG